MTCDLLVPGATIGAGRAGEMIHEVALAMRWGTLTGRLVQTVQADPTWSTGFRSASAQLVLDQHGRSARPARREVTAHRREDPG